MVPRNSSGNVTHAPLERSFQAGILDNEDRENAYIHTSTEISRRDLAKSHHFSLHLPFVLEACLWRKSAQKIIPGEVGVLSQPSHCGTALLYL